MKRAAVAVAVALAAAFLVPGTVALAGPSIMVVLSPDPATAGQQVTISFTGGFTNQCAQFPPNFPSTITLTPTGGGSPIGPIPFTGNPGTFTLPADTPAGPYSAEVTCSFSSNSAVTRSTTLTVLAAPPTPPTTPVDAAQPGTAVSATPSLTG